MRFPRRDSGSDRVLAEVRRLIRLSRAEGEHLRSSAPSRSTGYRRQFKRSHEGLRQIEKLVDP